MRLHGRFASCVALAACSAALAADPIEVPVGQRQLFLDDHGIARMENFKRTMHQPEKRGAVIVPDQLWEISLQTRCAPSWDPDAGLYKLWLITSTNIPSPPDVAGTTYAESPDGIHWTKPILRQYALPPPYSRENNFINVGPGQLEWPTSAMLNVVYDPDDPDPGRRYKGFLEAFVRRPIVSPDGIHWTRLDVPQLASSDESNLGYDRAGGMFIATLKTGGPHGRSHAIWTSEDFNTWMNTGVVFSADAEDQVRGARNIQARLADPTLQQPVHHNPADYNVDVYNIGIFRYEGLYIGMPAMYHATGRDVAARNTDGFQLIELTASRDLRTWERLGDRRPFIGPSPVGEGAYDLTQLLPPSAPVVHDDELWFYYTGIKYRTRPEDADPDAGAICLAVLRRDGFISLDAGAPPGTLVTKPLVAAGSDLWVNVDAAQGELTVEALNGVGRPLTTSETITGDQPRTVVAWKTGTWASLEGKTVTLRFTLRNASLYAFWLGE